MKSLIKAWDYIIFSNIFISIAAVCQTLFTYKVLQIRPNILWLFMVFAATFFVYNWYPINYKYTTNTPQSLKQTFILKHQKQIRGGVFISTIVLFSIVLFPIKVVISGLLLSLVSMLYFYSFRANALLKLFTIGFIWASTTTFLPLMEHKEIHSTLFILVHKMLFIIGITIPFDTKDIDSDTLVGQKTISSMIGAKKAYQVSVFITVMSFFMLIPILNCDLLVSSTIVLILSVIGINISHRLQMSERFYYTCIDGLLIVQYISLLLIDFV